MNHDLLPRGLRPEGLSIEPGGVTVSASSDAARARCPVCSQPSSRVHSRYSREVSDLPWHGVTVTIQVRVRRFFCDKPSCERKIFRERLPDVAARARKTQRLEKTLLAIVLELGGRAGARLAAELGLLVGRDALLARAKRAAPAQAGEVRVLGVDDFAFRKDHTYGTILVDLERRRVVNLLPERSQESLVAWLRGHPEIEVATRDRSHIYREGLAKGAPDAVQVTDRWHLLHNLASVLEEFLLQKRPVLRKAVTPEAAPEEKTDDAFDAFAPGPTTPNRPRKHAAKIEEAANKRHERLVEQWQDIRRLYLAGADVRLISRKLGISPRTVYRYKDLREPPSRQPYTPRASVLDPYVPYLLKRWNDGCHNGKRLLGEIRERGYPGSERTFVRFTGELRRTEAAGKPLSSAPRAKRGAVAGLSPTAKNVAALFMRREEKLNKEQKEYLGRLCEVEKRQPWQSFIETTFNIQRRMADFQFLKAESWEQLVVEHDRWLSDYNTQRHWAHENREDGRRSPSDVLRPMTLLRHHPGDLERAFFSTRFVRRLDTAGYARFRHWRIYGEEGLARCEVALWLGMDGLVVEYGRDTLFRYDVVFSPGSPKLEAVTNARLFATRHRTPQLKLFALEEVLGEGGWLKVLGLDGYANQSRNKPEMLQGVLFSYLEAL